MFLISLFEYYLFDLFANLPSDVIISPPQRERVIVFGLFVSLSGCLLATLQ